MIRQQHSSAREVIIANALSEVVSELRLVDLADYVAFIRLEHFACLADIVDSAAELYFMPRTLRLGYGGEAHVGWTESPKVVLDLEVRPQGATVYFGLSLTPKHAGVEIHYVSFDEPDPDPERNTAFLAAALEATRIRRSEPIAAP